jgi:uracil-DNA glycosylase
MRIDIHKYLNQYQDIYGPELFIDSHINIDRYYDEVVNQKKYNVSKYRKKIIIEEGNLKSDIIFVGESIAQEENSLSTPFGKNNHILFKKILNAIDLSLKDIFLINIVKCSSLNEHSLLNKDTKCEDYILKKIGNMKPNIVICLGLVPTFVNFSNKYDLDSLRNRIHNYKNLELLFTYHPHALIHNPNLKVNTWSDFKLIKRNYIDGK